MTTSERMLAIGMRVVVRDGPWGMLAPQRIVGHYGKIAEMDPPNDDKAWIHVALTGHVDGGHVDEVVLTVTDGWFYPEELDVVD